MGWGQIPANIGNLMKSAAEPVHGLIWPDAKHHSLKKVLRRPVRRLIKRLFA
jgi:hypothetical protein